MRSTEPIEVPPYLCTMSAIVVLNWKRNRADALDGPRGCRSVTRLVSFGQTTMDGGGCSTRAARAGLLGKGRKRSQKTQENLRKRLQKRIGQTSKPTRSTPKRQAGRVVKSRPKACVQRICAQLHALRQAHRRRFRRAANRGAIRSAGKAAPRFLTIPAGPCGSRRSAARTAGARRARERQR